VAEVCRACDNPAWRRGCDQTSWKSSQLMPEELSRLASRVPVRKRYVHLQRWGLAFLVTVRHNGSYLVAARRAEALHADPALSASASNGQAHRPCRLMPALFTAHPAPSFAARRWRGVTARGTGASPLSDPTTELVLPIGGCCTEGVRTGIQPPRRPVIHYPLPRCVLTVTASSVLSVCTCPASCACAPAWG
jgi:hypothetical protein